MSTNVEHGRPASRRERQPWVSLALGTLLLCPLGGSSGQVAPPSQPGSLPPASQSGSGRPSFGSEPLGMPDPASGLNPRKLEHMREDERRKRLMADTTRLVELTNELKTEIDKASKDELSLDVVRKAAEIEKLAHDVKERMKS